MATTTTTTTTLASRAAGLLSKASTLAIAEKALQQALDAKRVYPALAQDFGQQLGYEFPLKTRDFTRVVGHLLQSTDKPLKGVIGKRKADILAVLAELVGALTDTQPVQLPAWAVPKPKAEKASAEAEAASAGALEKANTLAEAEANAAKAEAAQDLRLAQAVAMIVSRASELTEEQRAMLASVLTVESAEAEAEAEAEAV